MPDQETLLAELLGFQQFEREKELQRRIEDTLGRYEDSALSADDLAAAAGGIQGSPQDEERSDGK